MRRYTEKTAAAVCNRLLQAARKNKNYPLLHAAWTDSKGRCLLTDSYRAYRLNKTPSGLSGALNEKNEPEKLIDLDRIFAPLDSGLLVEMPAPDPNDVKAFIERVKEQNDSCIAFDNFDYDLGPDYPVVNAKYLLDILRLFPSAKWFVYPDIHARMIRPIYAVCDEGSACVVPLRVFNRKPQVKPEAVQDRPATQRPETISKTETAATPSFDYYIYSRPAGSSRYYLTDMGQGTVGVNKFFAPRYQKKNLERIEELLDRAAADNPGASFQIRKLDGKRVVYTATPTISPEEFAALIAA